MIFSIYNVILFLSLGILYGYITSKNKKNNMEALLCGYIHSPYKQENLLDNSKKRLSSAILLHNLQR
jgi:pyrrolidone-carboxylate peptidase